MFKRECCDVEDVSTRLRDELEIVAGEDDLVLLSGTGDLHTLEHGHATDDLLAQEVVNLHELAVIVDVAVHGEMGVDKLHLVLVALCVEWENPR
jgi:hypothetical protein